jgi:hypothetical protein
MAEVPSVAHLERRLRELTEEAARVETLLECVRGLQQPARSVADELAEFDGGFARKVRPTATESEVTR